MQKLRLVTKIHQTQLTKNFFRYYYFLVVSSIPGTGSENLILDPDHWTKILDTDPNSMYMDPKTSVAEPVLFGRSRCEDPAPAPP